MKRTTVAWMSRAGVVFGLMALATGNVSASTLFGGLGGHDNGDSTNDGALATVDQTTGAVTIVGHPAGVVRISGLAFDPSGALWAATQPGGGFPPPPGPTGGSRLLLLNPANGSIVSNVPITVGATNISIADLAAQPGTGVLFGVRGPNDQLNGQGLLYTIDKATGAATLVGDTGHFFAAIAFAPDGTLYLASADLDSMGNVTNISFGTIDPANAATLTNVATSQFLSSLAVRREDGVIFGSDGDSHQLLTINSTTGAVTLIGDTGSTFIGDFDFQVPVNIPANVPTLSQWGMIFFAALLAGLGALQLRKRWPAASAGV